MFLHTFDNLDMQIQMYLSLVVCLLPARACVCECVSAWASVCVCVSHMSHAV